LALFSTTINAPRVFLGGLLAGAIINVCDIAVSATANVEPWQGVLRLESASGVTSLPLARAAASLVAGVVVVWLYAALRSTIGRGPGAGVVSALVAWLLTQLYAVAATVSTQPSWRAFGTMTAGLLAGYIIGGVAGARVYDRTSHSGRKSIMGRRR